MIELPKELDSYRTISGQVKKNQKSTEPFPEQIKWTKLLIEQVLNELSSKSSRVNTATSCHTS